MTAAPFPLPRSVIGAPFAVDAPVAALGRALWLYLALVAAASDRGVVVRTRMVLAKMIAVAEPTIDEWLDRLARARLIIVKNPSPYLVIVLTSWSAVTSSNADETPESAGQSGTQQREVPVSSKQAAAAASSKLGDGGPGEGVPTVDEIRSVLGDHTLDVTELVRDAPAPAVRRALQRVRLTPAAQIRKSKAALFRYLLTKFSEELDARDL